MASECSHSSIAAPRRAGGVALISVLLVVALTSAFASQMMSRHALAVAHARQVMDGAQAREYALGAEAFARQLLFEDWTTDSTMDTLAEAWAAPIQPFAIEGGRIELAIIDLERRFNANAVAPPKNLDRFKRLMAQLELDPNLADAWRDWIDRDELVHGFGGEDADYMLMAPAYRAANRPAANASEMMAVKGFTREAYERISPYVALLPIDQFKVNINTADAIVLGSLEATLAPDEIQSLMDTAREFKNVAEAVARYPGLAKRADLLTVSSEFFEVRVRVEWIESRAELISMLHRSPDSGEIRLLSRDFGSRVASIFETVESRSEAAENA